MNRITAFGKLVSPVVWRWTFVVLLAVLGLGLVTPQVEARGWMLLGRYEVAPALPFLIWGTLAVLALWAWRTGTLPELIVGFLIAAGMTALVSAFIATGTLDDMGLRAVPAAAPGPSFVVTLPAERLAPPATLDAKLAMGKVTVVIVQRHHDADGKSTLETTTFDGTLLADVVAGADVRVSVIRGEEDAAALEVVEDLADAEMIYLLPPAP